MHDTETMGLWELPAEPRPRVARVSAILEWAVLLCSAGAAVLMVLAGLGGWTEWLAPLLVG